MSGDRVVVIGFDAASWPLVEAEMASGHLPNLAALRARGHHGTVGIPTGLADNAVWASFSTGLPPDEHGWFYARHFRADDYDREIISRDVLTSPPFWQDASEGGRAVVVVDVPFSPIGHDLRGVSLADWTTHHELGHEPVSEPPDLAADVVARYGIGHVDGCVTLPATWEARRAFLAERASMTARKGDLVLDLMAEHEPDLTVVVFNAAHCVGHLFWQYHDRAHPRFDPAAPAELGDPIVDEYRRIDEQIGRVVEAAGPDAVITVFAGQGIGSKFFDQPWLDDVLYRMDPAIERETSVHHTARSAWRRFVPQRVREAMPDAWHRRARRGWYQQRAGRSWFSLTSDSTCGLVRVNLAGRERDGIVPPDQLKATLDQLEEQLAEVVDADTGEPLYVGFERMADRWTGPKAAPLPDLLVHGSGKPFRAAVVPGVGELPGPAPHKFCHHTQSGWYITTGPGFGDVDIADLAGHATAALD